MTDETVSVGSTKTTLQGGVGTFTWSSVSFEEQLGKVAWSARAGAAAGCRLAWALELSYADPVSKTVKVGAGQSVSNSRAVVADYDSGTLTVNSSCPKWSIGLTSYEAPPYWNPWGYNFKKGKLIYSAPADFCSYFDCIPSFWDSTNGYVAQCRDRMFSHSGGRRGACSWHGGVYRPLYRH